MARRDRFLACSLENRTELFDNHNRKRGVGSHGTLYLGERHTVVKDLKKELGPGLLADMCRQLGIRKADL
jgi:hypothetical protein